MRIPSPVILFGQTKRKKRLVIDSVVRKQSEADAVGESAVAATVRTLASMIADGRWPAGDSTPPQRELAKLLNISRATLREAISVLLTIGKIKARDNGRGFTIADLAQSQAGRARHLFAAGSLPTAARCRKLRGTACSHFPNGSDLARLRQALDAFRRAAISSDLRPMQRLTSSSTARFWRFAATGFSSTCTHFCRCDAGEPAYAGVAPGGSWPAVKEHELILEAIERGDPDGANYYMRKHIQYGGSRQALPPPNCLEFNPA